MGDNINNVFFQLNATCGKNCQQNHPQQHTPCNDFMSTGKFKNPVKKIGHKKLSA
jgi:hypothetical protein